MICQYAIRQKPYSKPCSVSMTIASTGIHHNNNFYVVLIKRHSPGQRNSKAANVLWGLALQVCAAGWSWHSFARERFAGAKVHGIETLLSWSPVLQASSHFHAGQPWCFDFFSTIDCFVTANLFSLGFRNFDICFAMEHGLVSSSRFVPYSMPFHTPSFHTYGFPSFPSFLVFIG